VPEIANHVPSLRIRWTRRRKIGPLGARRALIDGRPSIETAGGGNEIGITTWMMNPGEQRIVAQRLTQVLQGAAT
jgi:L-seryl-tRNA(Ser) seleniumtransferase